MSSSPHKRRNQSSSSKGKKWRVQRRPSPPPTRSLKTTNALCRSLRRLMSGGSSTRDSSTPNRPLFTSTHPSLTVLKNRIRSSWISTAAASVQLIHEKTSSGTDDAVLVLSLRSKTLEVHNISKLHFSWPQLSCIAEMPRRGSRTVFLNYRDGDGQMQKFALRFSVLHETENFMNVIKEILGNGSPPPLQCPGSNSEISSDTISSHMTIFENNEELQYTQSMDDSTQMMIPSLVLVATHQDSATHGAVKTESYFPPSFTQLMNGCRPEVSEARFPSSIMSFDASLVSYLGAATQAESGDLKTQFVQYLEITPFKDLLATVENVISQLGDDVML